MPALLSKAGLNDKPIEPVKRSFASIMSVPGADARPSLTESNLLEIPPGVSLVSARRAVVSGFMQESWSITAETDDVVIGVYRDDEDESRCTVTFKDRTISISHEGYRVLPDGARVAKEFLGWQSDLREAILAQLMGRSDGLPPPPGNELKVPQGVSMAATQRAVVAGFKEREWTIASEADGRVAGVYRKGKKEAVCTVTFDERAVTLVPEGYEVQADGKRVPVEHLRWQNNLKASIFWNLIRVTPEGTP
jgi:hypothetical protein